MLESILNPNINAILVKGKPGSGKTLLSIELARLFGRALYVSAPSSNEDTVRFHPALRQLTEEKKISHLTFGSSERDSRIDKPEFNVLDALQESIIEQSKIIGQPSLLVFDSWNRFVELQDGSSKPIQRLLESLISVARNNKLKLLFLSDESRLEATDYLFDAIVALDERFIHQRKLRFARLLKVSGSPIAQTLYPFTLEEGKFNFIRPPMSYPSRKYDIRFFIPRKDVTQSLFSSGSNDLDDFLGGGIPRSSSSIIEVSSSVDFSQLGPFFASLRLNFLSNNCCVAEIPTSEAIPESIVDSIQPYLPPSFVDSSFRLASYEIKEHPWSFPVDPNSLSKMRESFWSEIEKIRKTGQGGNRRPCLWLIGLDMLEALYGPNELLRFSVVSSQRAKYSGDAIIFLAKNGFQNNRLISGTCDRHLRIESISNSLFLYSVKPFSNLYSISYDFDPGFPQVSLTPLL